MPYTIQTVTVIFGIIVLSIVGSLLLSVPVWLLWNGCLVGAIDGLREITWLQSFGILILSNIFFKPFDYKKD